MSVNKLLTVRISEKLRQEFINQAHDNDTSARQLLLRWIKQYLGYPVNDLDSQEGRDRVNQLEERVGVIESVLATLRFSSNETASQLDSQTDNYLDTVNQSSSYNSQKTSQIDSALNTNSVENETTSNQASFYDNGEYLVTVASQGKDGESASASNNERTEENIDQSLETNLELSPLTQIQLARRLGYTSEGIKYQRNQGESRFQEWSRSKDPDGIGWQYREDKKYYPIS